MPEKKAPKGDKAKTDKQPNYATAKNPSISAIIHEMFCLPEAQAREKLQALREHFITSKEQPKDAPQYSVILWIKDYALTEEELKKGFMGNFALISYKTTGKDEFTLYATKIESELRYHPKRKHTGQRMPNWGHPVLRGVKRGKRYDTVDAINKEFAQLHKEYPDVTIPNPGKLYVMIYGRTTEPRVQKYVLEIKLDNEKNQYYIESRVNQYETRAPARPTSAAADEPINQAAPQGYFTARVALQRSKKRPKK